MNLIIKISKEQYEDICSHYDTFPAEMKEWGLEAIKNGKIVTNDYISRKAAEEITWDDPQSRDYLNVLTEVRERIRNLQSILPRDTKKSMENRLGSLDFYDTGSIEVANHIVSMDIPLSDAEAANLSPLDNNDPLAESTFLSVKYNMGLTSDKFVTATIRGEFEGGEKELELTEDEKEKLKGYLVRLAPFLGFNSVLEMLSTEVHQGVSEPLKEWPSEEELMLNDMPQHGTIDSQMHEQAVRRIRTIKRILRFAEAEYLSSKDLKEDVRQFKKTGSRRYVAFTGIDESYLLWAADNLATKGM